MKRNRSITLLRLSLLAGVVGLGASTSCAGHLATPGADASSWRELTSAHFRLRTDEDAEDARSTLANLERFRSGLLAAFQAPDDFDTGRIPVVVVDDGWTDIADRTVEGYYARALFQPWVVLRRASGFGAQDVIKHELVHFLSRLLVPEQPPWLSEGLATYFETAEEDPDRNLLTVGRPEADLLLLVQRVGFLPLRPLFSAKVVEGESVARFYATSWAVVHFLLNHHRASFLAYQRELAKGTSHDEAWRAAFPALTVEGLETALRSYLDGGQYELLSYRTPPMPAMSIAERALPEADRNSTQALLILTGYRVSKGRSTRSWDENEVRAKARAAIGGALALEPCHAPSLALAHFELGAPVNDCVDTARRQHADDWLTGVLWVEWLRQQGRGAVEQRAAMEEVESLVAADRSISLRRRRSASTEH